MSDFRYSHDNSTRPKSPPRKAFRVFRQPPKWLRVLERLIFVTAAIIEIWVGCIVLKQMPTPSPVSQHTHIDSRTNVAVAVQTEETNSYPEKTILKYSGST